MTPDRAVERERLDDKLAALINSDLRRLALQTRSEAIRDHLARRITGGEMGFDEFAAHVTGSGGRALLRPRLLTLLADLVATQRLHDNDPEVSLSIYERTVSLYGTTVLDHEGALGYADLLDRAGRVRDLRASLTSLRITGRRPAEAAALRANAALTTFGSGSERWLAELNALLALDSLASLTVAPGTAPLLDRLESTTAAASVDGPLVTVIVPTYNPGPWLWTAVRSLTQQTYANLEILVMDDHSEAAHRDQLDRLLTMDSRIRVITSPTNRGTYAGRNAALRDHAHGEYITVQDDDDWSHPQRIERQVQHAQTQGLALGIGRAARVTEDLQFVRRGATFVRPGYPSAFISRQAFADYGGWDPVRRNSDSEFIRRIRFAQEPVQYLGRAPLMLQRYRDGSLSSAEVWEGYTDQPRRWQEWLSFEWYERAEAAGQPIHMPTEVDAPRPYPAPVGLLRSASTPGPSRVDALVVADFGIDSADETTTLALAEHLLAEGKTVGLVHVDGLRPLATKVSPQVAALARHAGVLILSWGDETVADVAHVVETDGLLLCETVDSKLTAAHAVVYQPVHDVSDALVRLLHLSRTDAITPHSSVIVDDPAGTGEHAVDSVVV